jgi:hypothetical protein
MAAVLFGCETRDNEHASVDENPAPPEEVSDVAQVLETALDTVLNTVPDTMVSASQPAEKRAPVFHPSGIAGRTPILSWVNSVDSGIADVLPDDRWALPYQWLGRESAAAVWNEGRAARRPLKDEPVGLRAIRPWDTYFLKDGRPGESVWGFRDELVIHPGTPQARSLGFIAPWFDEWRTVAHERELARAAEMSAAGGQVDYLILDWENYNSFYDIKQEIAALGVTFDEYVAAVVQDARWPALRAALNRAAIDAGYDPDIVNFDNDLEDMATGWNNGHSPKAWVWARYMHTQILTALGHVLYDTWATYYPDLEGSDYQKYISGPWPEYVHTTWSVDEPTVPLGDPVNDKWIVGTHQAPEGYGRRLLDPSKPLQIHVASSYNPPQLPMTKWSPPVGMDEKFAVLIKTLRKLRGAVARQDADGNPPLMFWICGDQCPSSLWVPVGGAEDYRWYAEAMFHFGLHDVTTWLAWNTYRKTDGSSERRISDIVDEIDSLIGGFQDRTVVTTETIDWDEARYILSGMSVDDWRIYRFTAGEAGTAVSGDSDSFRFRFDADGAEVEPVPGAVRFDFPETMSDLGYWLVAEQ